MTASQPIHVNDGSPGHGASMSIARELDPAIQKLNHICAHPKDLELQRLFNKVPQLSEADRREIRQSFDRLTDRLFHQPVETLRAEERTGRAADLLDAFVRLFRCQTS